MSDFNKNADLPRVFVTGNKTLTSADQGIIQDVSVDAVITLPSTAAGLEFIIRNAGRVKPTSGPVGALSNKVAQASVSPAAADGFTGAGVVTPAVNKDLINTKATNKVGDYLKVRGTGTAGVAAWTVVERGGIWDREAQQQSD